MLVSVHVISIAYKGKFDTREKHRSVFFDLARLLLTPLSISVKFDASDLITDSTLTTSVDQTSQVMFKIDDTTVTK